MNIRRLELKDAPLMLEWMHDEELCRDLKADFSKKTIEDCEEFIKSSNIDRDFCHMAVVDECNNYMGTVSLKNINMDELNAEFGIAMRRISLGKGYSIFGMNEIIRVGLEELGLKEIVWCVSENNMRACRFYDKNGFERIDNPPQSIADRYKDESGLRWYIQK